MIVEINAGTILYSLAMDHGADIMVMHTSDFQMWCYDAGGFKNLRRIRSPWLPWWMWYEPWFNTMMLDVVSHEAY